MFSAAWRRRGGGREGRKQCCILCSVTSWQRARTAVCSLCHWLRLVSATTREKSWFSIKPPVRPLRADYGSKSCIGVDFYCITNLLSVECLKGTICDLKGKTENPKHKIVICYFSQNDLQVFQYIITVLQKPHVSWASWQCIFSDIPMGF